MFIVKCNLGKNLKKSFNYYISDFLVFLFAKFLITLSKSTCLAMLDSVFNLARSASRVCDSRPQIFFTSLSLLKNLSADATVAGIVRNILKLIQTFGNNSHGSHSSDHCFKAFCRNNVNGWFLLYGFEIFRFLGMSANPKLTFDSTVYQLAAQV